MGCVVDFKANKIKSNWIWINYFLLSFTIYQDTKVTMFIRNFTGWILNNSGRYISEWMKKCLECAMQVQLRLLHVYFITHSNFCLSLNSNTEMHSGTKIFFQCLPNYNKLQDYMSWLIRRTITLPTISFIFPCIHFIHYENKHLTFQPFYFQVYNVNCNIWEVRNKMKREISYIRKLC